MGYKNTEEASKFRVWTKRGCRKRTLDVTENAKKDAAEPISRLNTKTSFTIWAWNVRTMYNKQTKRVELARREMNRYKTKGCMETVHKQGSRGIGTHGEQNQWQESLLSVAYAPEEEIRALTDWFSKHRCTAYLKVVDPPQQSRALTLIKGCKYCIFSGDVESRRRITAWNSRSLVCLAPDYWSRRELKSWEI